ncbi:MAG: response regulator [Rhodocyclales bacterium]|nr:response regulator [Rhodocyclales bacterium]
MRLLIVDDSKIIRNRIARLTLDPRLPDLQIIGLASNGVEALQLAQQHKPELVTIDLTMPEMDGIECVGKLVAAFPDINILVVSALADKFTALQALKRGAKGFLHKPFSDDKLIEALLELMKD